MVSPSLLAELGGSIPTAWRVAYAPCIQHYTRDGWVREFQRTTRASEPNKHSTAEGQTANNPQKQF